MFLFRPPNIQKLKARRDVKSLIRALKYSNKRKDATEMFVRAGAAQALGEIGDTCAVEPLIAALKDEYSRAVRRAAARALGEIGDARAIEPLIAALKDDDNDMRTAVTEALAKIGAPAVESLGAILGDDDYWIRRAAAKALSKIGAPAVESLIARLSDVNKDVRTAAVEALGEIGDPRAIEPLISALQDNEWRVRQAAAEALGKISNSRATEPLIATLMNDSDVNVCATAARALGKIGDARAVEALIAMLKDSRLHVREAVASVLDQFGWQPGEDKNAVWYWIGKRKWEQCAVLGTIAVEPLIAVFTLTTGPSVPEREVRMAAAEALGEIGDAGAIEPLITALKDSDSGVCATVAKALGKLGDVRVVKPLISVLKNSEKDYVREAAAEALGQIGDPSAMEPLIVALKDSSRDVRRAAARVLDKLGWTPGQDESAAWYWIEKRDWERCIALGPIAVEPLIAVLKDTDEYDIAAGALGFGRVIALGGGPAQYDDRNKEVRAAAARALGQIGDARAMGPLTAALDDRYIRTAAAEALRMLKTRGGKANNS